MCFDVSNLVEQLILNVCDLSQIQGELQRKKQLEDKMADLQVQEIVLLEEYDEIQTQIQPLNENLEVAIGDKEQAREAHKIALYNERNKVNTALN